ncbi:hypothetical protein ACRWVS_23800 [Escherichia coli]
MNKTKGCLIANFATVPILGLLAEPLMELLNKTMPWHKLLVPEPADESTENSSEISQQ